MNFAWAFNQMKQGFCVTIDGDTAYKIGNGKMYNQYGALQCGLPQDLLMSEDWHMLNDSVYFLIKITDIKGTYYICKATGDEYNRLVAHLIGLNQSVVIISAQCVIESLLSEITAKESLKNEDYMFISFKDLCELLHEVKGIEVR